MDTQLLYHWAKFHKMNDLEKRELLTTLIAERLSIRCEARIYRVLTRLSFQSLRKKYEAPHAFTPDEELFSSLLTELGLSPSTSLKWYWITRKKVPLKLQKGECSNLSTANICECSIEESVKEQIKNNYEYRLASKRLYQIIVKAELFKDSLVKEGLFLSDDDLRKGLRRLVEQKYYSTRFVRRTRFHLNDKDLKLSALLQRKGITAICVLRWLYLIKHHPELVRQAQQGKIQPDEIFEKPMLALRDDFKRGDL